MSSRVQIDKIGGIPPNQFPRTYSHDDVIEYRKKLDDIAQTQFDENRDAARYRLLRTMTGSEWAETVGANEELDSALDELLERQSNPETSFGAAAHMDMAHK